MESYTAVVPVDSLKQEDLLFCLTCLSEGRELRPLGANKQLFQKLCENNVTIGLDDALLCWECHAVLNKVTKFVNKACQAEIILSNSEKHINSLSTLKSVKDDVFIEMKYVGEDDVVKAIKSEATIYIERDTYESDFPKDFDYVHVEDEKWVYTTAKLEYNANENTEINHDIKITKSDNDSDVTFKIENRDDDESLGPVSKARCSVNKWQKYKDCVLNVPNEHDKARTYRLVYLTRDQVDDWIEKARRDDSYIRDKYKCSECVLSWKKAKKLNDHRRQYHNNKFRYICDVCTCSYQNKRSLIMHMRIHFCDFVCQVCNEQFHKRKQMHIHFRTVHKDVYTKWRPSSFRVHRPDTSECAYCAECNMQYRSEYIYKQHLKEHSKHVTQRLPCPECDKTFASKTSLKYHINIQHNLTSDHVCSICNKLFTGPQKLTNHIKHVHNKVPKPKIFECVLCNKKFSSKTILESHMNIHTGDRPYKCKMCEASFGQSGALYKHKQLVHKMKKQSEQTVDQKRRSKANAP